jgi:hypothetical protein
MQSSSLALSSPRHHYCAFFGYIDTLPLGLCLIDIVCFDNAGVLLCLLWPYRYFASRATLPLGLLCLLGYSASWAALPLGLLCFLGCFASWATLPLGLLCLLGYFASWAALPLGLYIDTLPLGPCLIDIIRFDNASILICLLGCAIIGHLLVCKMISYVNMPNRDTL